MTKFNRPKNDFISKIARADWIPGHDDKPTRNLWISDLDKIKAAGHSYTAIDAMAKRQGYTWGHGAKAKIEGHIDRHWDLGAQGNWMTSLMGSQGFFGLPEYNKAKDAGRTDQEIFDAFHGSKLKIDEHVRRTNMAGLSAAQNADLTTAIQDLQDSTDDKYNDLQTSSDDKYNELQNSISDQIAEVRASVIPTIQRSGHPGAVGKPAAGMSIAQGTNYSGGSRGLSSLKRDSAYFMNNLGGVTNKPKNNSPLNIR